MSASLAASRQQRPPPVISRFEFWPGALFYAPVIAQWTLLSLRHGSISLPTAANPGVSTGGLCGEGKTEFLDRIAGPARALVAPYVVIETGADDPGRARAALGVAGIAPPVVVKPDVGCNGTGVLLARDEAALDRALAAFPRGVRLVVQELIPWESEAGLFWVRHPDEAEGRVTSLTLKHAPSVVGDGQSTLRALLRAHPRAGLVPHLYEARLAGRLDGVPAAGERVRLVFAGNHCKGSEFRDGAAEITPALTARVAEVAAAIPGFHFGRLDVRYESLPALRRGEGMRLIEVNGVGSEATHVWDPATTLRAAWGAELAHFGAAWRIGAAMRRRGHRPTGTLPLLRQWLRQRRLMASYPLND